MTNEIHATHNTLEVKRNRATFYINNGTLYLTISLGSNHDHQGSLNVIDRPARLEDIQLAFKEEYKEFCRENPKAVNINVAGQPQVNNQFLEDQANIALLREQQLALK